MGQTAAQQGGGFCVLGYRYPDKNEEDEEARRQMRVGVGFDEQFEDGPHGEIFFYRGGLGRPVRVSESERTDVSDRWDRYKSGVDQAYLGALGLIIIVLIYHFGFDAVMQSPFLPVGLIAGLAGHAVGRRLLRNHLVRPFRDRFPAGPTRTRWMRYSAKADGVSWGTLGSAVAGLLFLVASRIGFDRPDAIHRSMALLEFALGSGIFLIAAVKLKNWFDRR